jgi:hypothetical protein
MRKWMMAAAVLLLGTGSAAAQGQAPAQNCVLKQIESIPMEVYPDHLVLPVSFGTTPEKLVFRMEDAGSAINGDLADKLDLHITSLPPNVHFRRNGEDLRRLAHVRDMHLGRLTIGDMEFLMLNPGTYGDGLAGDLGTQLFDKVDMELDIAGGKFNLFASDHCPGRAVYWTKDYAQLPLKREKDFAYLRANVTLDGQPLTVSFATAGRSRIGMDAMRRLFHIDETSPQLVAVGQDLLGRKTYRFPFKSLNAEGLTVNNPDILVFDEPPRPECKEATHFTDPDPIDRVHSTAQPRLTQNFGCNDAVLGLSVLSKLRIYVSRQENLLYISAAGAK